MQTCCVGALCAGSEAAVDAAIEYNIIDKPRRVVNADGIILWSDVDDNIYDNNGKLLLGVDKIKMLMTDKKIKGGVKEYSIVPVALGTEQRLIFTMKMRTPYVISYIVSTPLAGEVIDKSKVHYLGTDWIGSCYKDGTIYITQCFEESEKGGIIAMDSWLNVKYTTITPLNSNLGIDTSGSEVSFLACQHSLMRGWFIERIDKHGENINLGIGQLQDKDTIINVHYIREHEGRYYLYRYIRDSYTHLAEFTELIIIDPVNEKPRSIHLGYCDNISTLAISDEYIIFITKKGSSHILYL